jgi:hypothetical protein
MPQLKHWLEGDHWWFQNPDPDGPSMGPYQTKREMLDDKAGIERTSQTKTWISIMKESENATERTDGNGSRQAG